MNTPTAEAGSYVVELMEPDRINPDYARRTADALPLEFKRRLLDGAVAVWRGNLDRVPRLLGEARSKRLRQTGMVVEAILGIPGMRGQAKSTTPWWKPKADARIQTQEALKADPTLWMDVLWFWVRAQFDHVLHAAEALAGLAPVSRARAQLTCRSATSTRSSIEWSRSTY